MPRKRDAERAVREDAPLRFREGRETDLAAIHAIELASFADPWALEGFRDMLDHPRAKLIVVEGADALLVGYAVAWFVADESEIANFAIAPSARRLGIGGRLLDRIIDEASTFGAATVFLEVRESNVAAQSLYASRGFVPGGRRPKYYRRPEEDALVMRLAL
jgi:ribosomal-protein-alanine N-acetyltransferase